MRHPSFSGPASTVSKPNWSRSRVTVAFALGSVLPSPLEQPTSLETFLAGYTQHCELDEDVYALLPVFWRLASLQRYARLVRALDLPAGQEYPEWMELLQAKLVAWVARYLSSLPREP